MEQPENAAAEPETEVLDDEPEVVDAEEALRQELAAAQTQAKEMKEHVMVISAEFENFRRRQQEEQKRRQVLMKEELFRELLPLVDNLDRSLEAGRANPSAESLLKGVELIRRGFDRLLENNEVTVIGTAGVEFDANLHEAMMVEERDDVPDQSIVQELQKGYKIGERVLRASMVKVARNTQTANKD